MKPYEFRETLVNLDRAIGPCIAYNHLMFLIVNRWRALEAALACSASNSESITEYLDDEDSVQSFDVKGLSTEILPSLRELSGMSS